eukprot:Em0004g1194a
MDVTVELSLLQKRFTGAGVESYGTIRSEFVCARRRDAQAYEGRLFLMDKALLFVSTYAESHDHDVIIKSSDIEQITVCHSKTIPTMEIALATGDEVFSNFHNYSGVVSALERLLPAVPVKRKSSGLFRSISSAPPTPASASSLNPLRSQAEQCTYDAKGGFCPRMPLCKLEHTSHLATRPTKKQQLPQDTLSGHIESPKRPHIDQPPSYDHLLQGAQGGLLPAYNRSVSLPFPFHVIQPGGVSEKKVALSAREATPSDPTSLLAPKAESTSLEDGELSNGIACQMAQTSASAVATSEGPAQQSHASSDKGGAISDPLEPSTSQSLQPGSEGVSLGTSSSTLDQGTEQTQSTLQAVLQSSSSPFPLPSSFNFYKGAAGALEEGVDANPSVPADGGLFVFNSTPAEKDLTPGGLGVVPVGPPPPTATLGGGVISPPLTVPADASTGVSDSDVAALLAQQLALDSSDSMDEDFDIDSQIAMLERFTANRAAATSAQADEPVVGGDEGSQPEASVEVRKRPCYYFMTGYCRNGDSCPNSHSPNLNFDDMSNSGLLPEAGELSLPSTISVYSANSVARHDLNSGDKIILSPYILLACEHREIAYPMSFKLENTATGACLYAGVLDFTSPVAEQAYIPQWMMDHLGASDGSTVSFEHVTLPKGTFVKLQPVSSVWLGIPYDKRMAMMEFQLRNFQTLTEGTKVTLNYENNRYTLKVLECRPNKGISIVDADITTDILEPADFSRFHSIEEGQGERIELEEPVQCTTEAGVYRHFVLLSLGQPLPPRLRIEVKATKGDPDLFLCQNCVGPTQRRYTWCSQDVGSADFYLSVDNDPDYDVNRPLYAGVVGLCEDAQFTVCFHREDTLAAAKARVNKPSSYLSGRKQIVEETDSAPPPGQERCSYCGSVMSSLRLLMHQKHCAQSTFKCSICGVCLPKAAQSKHHKIAHELIRCDCSLELTQLDLHEHQKSECTKKTIKCSFQWCNLSFPLDQIEHHESICARKNVTCPICSMDVTQLELEQHLQALHSVDTNNINWLAPLANQLTSMVPVPTTNQLKCICNREFQFQDDLEVHQLTECPLQGTSDNGAVFVG